MRKTNNIVPYAAQRGEEKKKAEDSSNLFGKEGKGIQEKVVWKELETGITSGISVILREKRKRTMEKTQCS